MATSTVTGRWICSKRKDGGNSPQSLDGDPEWVKHPFNFGSGGAQMYAYDVNGDGKNDVITSLEAHGYGLAWFEQIKDDKGEISFKQHLIMGKLPQDNKYGVKFSQPHAVDLVDMNGDGLKDIVTGKRWWAHAGGDPEVNNPAVLYWFELNAGPTARPNIFRISWTMTRASARRS